MADVSLAQESITFPERREFSDRHPHNSRQASSFWLGQFIPASDDRGTG